MLVWCACLFCSLEFSLRTHDIPAVFPIAAINNNVMSANFGVYSVREFNSEGWKKKTACQYLDFWVIAQLMREKLSLALTVPFTPALILVTML